MTHMTHKDLLFKEKDLVFQDVLSRRTAYGLIWTGTYRQHQCVIKMIMLTTGYHFDKDKGVYHSPHDRVIGEDEANTYFGHNNDKPFWHLDFRHRRSMTPEAFLYELDAMVRLGELKMAPHIYGYGIDRSHAIHYGFIVMERVDCSLKDIYLKRELHSHERHIVCDLIDTLHFKHGILHGDLKPSNMGVYLDSDGLIKKGCFFDCQKIKFLQDCDPTDFKHRAEREATNFKKHIEKNRQERPTTTHKHVKREHGYKPI
jgi:hypothetical protein